MTTSLYDLLEIPATASPDQIDNARGRAMALWTEDWSRETGVLQEHLDAAWHVLRNPSSRAAYDSVLADGKAPDPDDLVQPTPVKIEATDEALEALRRDWPANLPPLPGTVSEVTMWGNEEARYKPAVSEDAPVKVTPKLSRKQQKLMNEVSHGGFRKPNVVTRFLAGVMMLGATGAVVVGGYLAYISTVKKDKAPVAASAVGPVVTSNPTTN